MPDYGRHDPKGWCGDPKRGAAMGRPAVHDEDGSYTGRLSLSRVHINDQGYDKNGTYFGVGPPLFWCANEDGTIDYVLRAKDRVEALVCVLRRYPKAKVRR